MGGFLLCIGRPEKLKKHPGHTRGKGDILGWIPGWQSRTPSSSFSLSRRDSPLFLSSSALPPFLVTFIFPSFFFSPLLHLPLPNLDQGTEVSYWCTLLHSPSSSPIRYSNKLTITFISVSLLLLTLPTDYPAKRMMSRKFHASSSMAYLHKCPLNYTLPYGRSNFQSDFFAILIENSDSLQKTTWRKCFSFLQILTGTPSKSGKTIKNWTYPNLPSIFLVLVLFDPLPLGILEKER